MMGPLLCCRNPVHLEQSIAVSRSAGIRVRSDEDVRGGTGLWFRRDWGLVHGTLPLTVEGQPVIYFGFGHAFNPLLWPADKRLLRDVELLFLTHGWERIASEEAAQPRALGGWYGAQ